MIYKHFLSLSIVCGCPLNKLLKRMEYWLTWHKDWQVSDGYSKDKTLIWPSCFGQDFNSLWPDDEKWHQRSCSPLIQAIVFFADGAKPLPQLLLTYGQYYPDEWTTECITGANAVSCWLLPKLFLKSHFSQVSNELREGDAICHLFTL